MRETLIVLRRELHSYFVSPIAYVFGFLLLGCTLFFTSSTIEHGGYAQMLGFFVLLPILFAIFLPALTMRLWAEERKIGTIELLLTFPVKVSHLVAGKFGAALIVLGIVMLLTIGLPLTLSAYGNLDWGPVLGAYLGTMLLASAYLSVGMFCSALTRDQIVAMLFTLVALLILLALGHPTVQLLMSLAGWPETLNGMLMGLSPYTYFLSISRGVLDSRDLIFYLCFCGFFLFANCLVLQHRKAKG